ncbi:hypothetical protein WA158_000876 [Blastocystis sp. Blastoise]
MEEQRGHWMKYSQPSYGDEAGEVYFYNTITGESTWDIPEEFKDEIHEEKIDEVVLKHASTVSKAEDLAKFLKDIGLDKQENIKPNSVRLLYEGCKNIATPEDWAEYMKQKDYLFIQILLFIFNKTTDLEELIATCHIFIFLAEFDESILGLIKYEKFISMKYLYNTIGKTILQHKDEDLLPLYVFLDALLRYDTKQIIKLLPTMSFLKVLTEYANNRDELFVNYALSISLSISYYCSVPDKNPFLQLVYSNTFPFITSDILKTINLLGTPCKDDVLLLFILVFLGEVFSTERNKDVFYTNDIHMLIDIIIREVQDLPRQDLSRTRYLMVLQGILETSDWKQDLYRHKDIYECLHSLMYIEGVEETARKTADELVVQFLEYLQ